LVLAAMVDEVFAVAESGLEDPENPDPETESLRLTRGPDDVDVESDDVASVFAGEVRKAKTRPATSSTTTTTVEASMRRERLSGMDDSPIIHCHHCFNPCAQFLIESPLHRESVQSPWPDSPHS
jgi:hypothetical protein